MNKALAFHERVAIEKAKAEEERAILDAELPIIFERVLSSNVTEWGRDFTLRQIVIEFDGLRCWCLTRVDIEKEIEQFLNNQFSIEENRLLCYPSVHHVSVPIRRGAGQSNKIEIHFDTAAQKWKEQ